MPRYLEDVDDAEFLSPDILRIADTPSPVKPLPTSSYAAGLSTSHNRSAPRTNLHSQFAAMPSRSDQSVNPFASSSSSSNSSTPLSVRPSQTFTAPVSSASGAVRSSPYFTHTPLASASDAPTLAEFFGEAPRGMTAVITRDSLSPRKQPPPVSRHPPLPFSSSYSSSSSLPAAPSLMDTIQSTSASHWKSKIPLGSTVSSRPTPSLSSTSSSAASASFAPSDDVIDLAGDDDYRINSPPHTKKSSTTATSSSSSTLSAITAHSEKQINDLLHSPNKQQSSKQNKTKHAKDKRPKHIHITIQIVGPSLIGVSAQPDDARVTDIVRNVSGAVWDEKGRMWTCRVSAVNALVSRFDALSTEESEVTVDAPDERLLADERRREAGGLSVSSSSLSNEDEKQEVLLKEYKWLHELPKHLARAMYPFQRDGVDFALKHNGRVLIGDEMGLGKTIQSIAIAGLYKPEWPCLIVCPSSLRLNWKNELIRWLRIPSREVQVIMSGKDRLLHRAYQWKTNFTIISYDLVIKFEPSIKKANYSTIICDESHYLKSLTAKRTKALLPILKKTKHCILLSGTPALSRPIELYNQISVLSDKFGSYHDFGMRYAKGKKGSKGAANLAELHFLLKQNVMIRRLKEEVLTELRPKQRTAVMVSIDDKEVEAKCKRLAELKDMANSLVNTADTAAPLSGFTQEKRNELFEMYRKSGEAKLSSIIQYIADLLENNLKFLIFAHHLSVLDGIEKYLKANRYAYFRLDGSTNATERQRGVDWFQSDANCKVALLSITAGGTGITLTASSTVVFAELTFTPALLLQAEDRVHRIGQPNAVNIHYLLGRHSLDDMLWPLLVKKMAVVGSSLDGEEADMEFEGVRGGESEQDKGRFNVGQKGMARWLEREAERKAVEAKRQEAIQKRREAKWRDAIEIGDDDDEDEADAFVAVDEADGLSAERETELDDEVQEDMWMYVSDEDEKNFIVDDNDEEGGEEGETEYKEEREEDEEVDEDERFDSDEDYEQPDAKHNGRDEDEDEEEEEEEYQPKHSRGKKRVLRSDDDDEVNHLLSNNSLTPVSSSSSLSTPSASQSQWASTFGIDRRTIESESREAQIRQAREEARQKEWKTKKQRRIPEEYEEEDEDPLPVTRKPSAATRNARDQRSRRREEERVEEEEDADADDGLQYNESDLSVMLLSMGYSDKQVQSVLFEMRDDTDEEQMYDVNTALETLIRLGHTQPTAEQTEERKEGAPDSESVPCERCGTLVSFFDYTTHLGQCRRTSTQQAAAASSNPSAAAAPAVSSRGDDHERKEAPTAQVLAEDDEAEEAEVEEEQVRVKPAPDRRKRIIDLKDEEEVEEQIVTSQEKRSANDDDEVSVQDEVNVEWLDE